MFEFPDLNPPSGVRASAAVTDVMFAKGETRRKDGIALHSPLGEVSVREIRCVVSRLAKVEWTSRTRLRLEFNCGGPGRDRTDDTSLFRRVLYH